MANQTKNFSQTNWMRLIVIPVFLLISWFLLTSWYIIKFDQSFLVLSYNHNAQDFTQISHDRLLKGEKLAGEFVANENNLGIVSLRFKSFQRIPYKQEDMLVFRIKEKGQKEWYYENRYRSGFVYDVPFLPFGFPLIADSEGKTYIFELESLKGDNVNGVALSTRQPFIASKYQADKATLQQDYAALATFGWKKFFNSFNTIDVGYSSLVFALPLIIYLFWISPARKHIVDPGMLALKKRIDKYGIKILGKRYKYVQSAGEMFVVYYLLTFLLLVVLVDIVILQIYNDFMYIVIGLMWLLLIRAYKLDGKYSIGIGLLLLTLAPLYLQLNVTNIAEKAGAWAFIYILVGILQFIIDVPRNQRLNKNT